MGPRRVPRCRRALGPPNPPERSGGGQELSNAIIDTLHSDPPNCIGGYYSGCLMANHGIICVNSNLKNCFKVPPATAAAFAATLSTRGVRRAAAE